MRVSRLLLSLAMIPRKPVSPPLPYLFNSEVYGPFENTKNYSISFSVLSISEPVTLSVKYYNNRTNSRLAVESYSLAENDTRLNYTLRTKGRMSSDGLRVEFTMTNEIKDGTQTFIIYPTNPAEVYSYLYKENDFYTNNTVFQFTGRTSVKNYEKISFKDTVDYITNSINNTLELDEITFKYDDGKPLIGLSDNKYLRFKDEYNLFPYIPAGNNSYKQIPLSCTQSGETISFLYKNEMFYDPSSFQMSLTNQNGFSPTNSFYLPKSSLSLLEKYDFEIYMPSFGRGLNNVHIPLQFYKDKNFTGFCSNSNYCIKGGLKE